MADKDKKGFFDKLPDNIKTILKDVSTRLKEYNAEFAEMPMMADGSLKDGTKIKYTGDKLDKGSEVFIVTESGEVPAPEGEHMLPDDSIMVIVKEGDKSVVSEVKPAQEAEMESESDTDKKISERVTKIVEKFKAEFQSQIDSQSETIKKQKIEIENLKLKLGKQAKLTEDAFSVMQAFSDIPTDEPIEKPEPGKKPSTHNKKMALVK